MIENYEGTNIVPLFPTDEQEAKIEEIMRERNGGKRHEKRRNWGRLVVIMALSGLSMYIGVKDDANWEAQTEVQVEERYPDLSNEKIDELWKKSQSPSVLAERPKQVVQLQEQAKKLWQARNTAVFSMRVQERAKTPERFNADIALMGTGFLAASICLVGRLGSAMSRWDSPSSSLSIESQPWLYLGGG